MAEITVQYVSEEDRFADDFKPPSQFFIVNAIGEGVYFHTRSRQKAQDECNKLYPPCGKYTVRVVVKAGVR